MWFYLLACQSEVTPKKQVVIEEKVETEEADETEETEAGGGSPALYG